MDASHRKTRRTFNEPGHAHHLTFSCYQRLPLLVRDRTRLWVIEAIRTVRTRHNVSLLAYVIMPEHVHLLVWPRQKGYRVERLLYDLKRPVSIKARRFLEDNDGGDLLSRLTVVRGRTRTFRFWQAGGGFDRNLVDRRSLRCVAEYIHGNPVRRGLVTSPQDWPWSSAAFWNGRTDVPLDMDSMDV
ncbi:MAG TPA: transposase [Phycisphaerae bacterium]|nr:transposase [Phycisphaerae bacterium]HOI56879.1 transposase [Phycisphaerae bacterium]